ncbi:MULTISPECIES: acyltransferase family protein [unclassified Sphingomonas]|nr:MULTISPECIES: acyltransferase [unclassified Sphingomonas]KQX26366.1 acyltransferase [Sphingomonas sp. Root1294]KQY69436.1 acyltransferase [Sphingomonas sp. Root50]KRB89515.1 acyltransferase [Sphingomonas sp. Root720]
MARQPLVPSDRARFYRNNFDAIRLAMALLVVFSHSYALRLGDEAAEPVSIATNGHYNAGNIGVWVFFIVSGFLIAHSHERASSLASYAVKRIRRIYPGYLVATSVCAFVVTPLFAPPGFVPTIAEAFRTLGANLLLANHFPLPHLFAANPIPAVNGALWSIKFEALCYVGVALLGILALSMRRWTVPLLYVVVVAIWCWLDLTGRKPGGPRLVYDVIGWPYLWFQVLPNFLAGMIAYLHRDHIPRSTALLVVGLAAAMLAFHLGGRGPTGIVAAHVLAPPALAYLVFWFAFHPGIDLSGAARYGDFSYGTYLYAFVIQQMLVATTDLPFPLFVLASMALALAAGVASWWLVERNFLDHGRKPAEHRPERKEAPALP